MNYRKILAILLALAVFSSVAGVLLIFSEEIGLCHLNDVECVKQTAYQFGHPLAFGFPLVALSLLFVILSSETIFRAWWKPALILFIFTSLWVTELPITCGSLICFDKKLATWFSGIAFLLLTLLIILYKTLQSRRKSS